MMRTHQLLCVLGVLVLYAWGGWNLLAFACLCAAFAAAFGAAFGAVARGGRDGT